MKDRESGKVLSRWAEISSKAAQLSLMNRPSEAKRRGSLNVSLATIAASAAIVLAVLILQRPGGGSSDTGGGVGNVAPSAVESGAELGTEFPSEVAGGTSSGLDAQDLIAATTKATAFETARSAGAWTDAWSMLSPYSQATYGSESTFATIEGSYNAEGGVEFTLAEPTRNPDLLDLSYLGDPGADAQAHADFDRGSLVFVNHPNVRGASEASRAYLIAPVASGEWKVWVVR